VKTIPSQNDPFIWIKFQDPPAFISKGSLSRSILIKFEKQLSFKFILGKTMTVEAMVSKVHCKLGN
jgi:hypothetical protein